MRVRIFMSILVAFCLLLSANNISLAAPPVQDRYQSTYQPSRFNNDYLLKRMNCYGYATQLYYVGSLDTLIDYRQQPGEFAINSEPFSSLMQSYYNSFVYWNNLYIFTKDRVFEDFSSLGWWITEVSDSSQAPAGFRKIALVIRQEGITSDFHFYMQHSDGTWSHKPGVSNVINTSLNTGAVLTNNNISSAGQEGGYNDGIRFFLIGKDAVTDYPHFSGHYNSATYTSTDFRDKAGDSITQSTTIYGNTSARFDYLGDKDFYAFTPSTSKYYTITTSASSGYDVDGVLYDANGNSIAQDYSSANASFYAYLNANTTYYIGMWDHQNHIDTYTLYVN